jgi:hypothetical protein
MPPEPTPIFGLSGDELKLAITILYLVVSSLIALIVAVLLYKFLKLLVRLFRTVGSVFGDTATSKLISLGLASFAFPSVVPATFTTLLSFFSQLVENVPNAFYLPSQGIKALETMAPAEVISELANMLFRGWAKVFSVALGKLWNLPLRQGVLMIGLGALIGLLLRQTEEAAAAPGTQSRRQFWVSNSFRSLDSTTRKNLAFFVIIAIAGYLSIAAIAAIPALRESSAPSAEISSQKLKERLETLRQESDASFVTMETRANPFEKLEKLAAEPDAIATSDPSPPVENVGPEKLRLTSDEKLVLKQFLNDAGSARNEALNDHANLVSDLKKQRDEAATSLLGDYEINTWERKGRREAARYFLDVVDWYRRKLWWMRKQIVESAEGIRGLERFCASQADSMIEQLSQPNISPGGRSQYISSQAVTWSGVMVGLRGPPPLQSNEAIPERPELGAYLGPFTLVAHWLLRTENLSLALIVGMIGFGLLGSACSSFVREKKEMHYQPGQPLVGDLSGVILRGVSAAIVVFLAAQGGLAIFGSGAAEPNPYVLLLTCLVAAVFSDAVWERAQNWFKSVGEKRSEPKTSDHSKQSAKQKKTGKGTAGDDQPRNLPD